MFTFQLYLLEFCIYVFANLEILFSILGFFSTLSPMILHTSQGWVPATVQLF